jgi:hypothetical protein
MLSWGEEILSAMSRPRKYPEELLVRGVRLARVMAVRSRTSLVISGSIPRR